MVMMISGQSERGSGFAINMFDDELASGGGWVNLLRGVGRGMDSHVCVWL